MISSASVVCGDVGFMPGQRERLWTASHGLHLANDAMNSSQAEAVQALLDAKASRGVGAQDDTNALHFAAMQGQVEVCKLLLAAGRKLSVCSSMLQSAQLPQSQIMHLQESRRGHAQGKASRPCISQPQKVPLLLGLCTNLLLFTDLV